MIKKFQKLRQKLLEKEENYNSTFSYVKNCDPKGQINIHSTLTIIEKIS
jgi:hypothetical protein